MTSDVEYQFKVSKLGILFALFRLGLFLKYTKLVQKFSALKVVQENWNTTSEITAKRGKIRYPLLS